MICPRCTFPLQPHREQGALVDACARCGGAFYERSDLEPRAGIRALVEAGTARALRRSHLPCPRGHGALVAYRCEAPDEHRATIEIDVCAHPECHGFWLDAGEGRTLRAIAAQSAAMHTGPGWYVLQLVTGLPLEVWHPIRHRPVGVWMLIAACVMAFAVELVAAASDRVDDLVRVGGVVPGLVLQGQQPWSLLTHLFLHGGVGHLFGNMAYLWIFGDNIEDIIGRRRFLINYLIFGLVAAATQIAWEPTSDTPLVGASGAIAGLLGAYVVLFPRVQVFVVFLFIRFRLSVWFYLGAWLLMNVGLGSLASLDGAGDGGVAWWAHVGGFVGGAGWALVNRRRVLALRP